MNTFSTELKKERESKNITLAEIAKKTRINIKYLEAIEQGTFDILPQTYIRAFIKAYAETIGLPANEILKKYETQVSHQFVDNSQGAISLQQAPLHPQETEKLLSEQKKNRSYVVGIVLAAIVLASVIYFWGYIKSYDKQQDVNEMSFQDVVKENEQSRQPKVTKDSSDTSKTNIASPAAAADSLVLRVVATDSVWINIIQDSLPPRRGYLLVGRFRTYTAQREFTVSFGNAGAVRLFLNGIELEPLGPKGRSVRNIKINREYLKKQ